MKIMMMKTLLFTIGSGLLLLSSAFAQGSASAQSLILSQNSKTSYVIALADDAIPAEKTAAGQLQTYLQEVTGAAFPIEPEAAVPGNAPQILVGAGSRVKELLPHQNWDILGHDGIVIQTIGNNKLILAGGRPRGTLYAVFQFLEDGAGCRWWTPTADTIPHRSTLQITPQNVVFVPPFDNRCGHTNGVVGHPVFATIMHENGYDQDQTEEWGGHYGILEVCHTFSRLLPPEIYFKDHPEWYSDPTNGDKPGTASSPMPGGQQTQLCVSNPQVVDETARQAVERIKKYPDVGNISISQNDNDNFCQDPQSMQLAREEGSQSGPVLNFVNQVAQKIHQQYPRFTVQTLAYGATEKPPKTIRPGQNVSIQMAPVGDDFGHPMDSDWNKTARDNLLGWSKIAPRIDMWYYITNFHGNMLPYPDWDSLGKDLRFFAANNVKGILEQGDSYTNGVGDFVQLRTWLIGNLTWNPQLDQEKLTHEFLQGYYGAAGPYLQQYLDLVQQSFLKQNRKLTYADTDLSFFTLDVTNQAIRLFDQAANAVKNDKVLSSRVARERLSFNLAVLYRYKMLQIQAAEENKPFLGPKDPALAMQKFIDAAKYFGVKNFTEGGPFADEIPALSAMYSPSVNLPDFVKKYPAMDVIDLQQNNFSLSLLGLVTSVATDPNASDQKAATVIGDTNQWAVQISLGQFIDASIAPKWHVYAMARVATKAGAAQQGIAFQSGIYDVPRHKPVSSNDIPLAGVTGTQYQCVDLGVHTLDNGMYIWFAPVRNPAVEKLYIDRVLLVRDK